MKREENSLKLLIIAGGVILFIGLFIAIVYFYVSRQNDDFLNDREVIEQIIPAFGLSDFIDVKNNAEIAISKFENKSIDPDPVLILARLRGVFSDPEAYLDLLTYDEDGDLAGIIIKEIYHDTNGNQNILEEDYPVFKFWSPSKGTDYPLIFVTLRKTGQIKSEEAWNKYVTGESVEDDKIINAEIWGNTLPEFLISVPEPDKIDVELYLYDKAGHKSKPILLRHVEVTH